MSDIPSADTPDPTPPDSEETTSTPAQPVGGRRRAIMFVVVFLVTTFVLLTAFQFMSRTVWMQHYLFTVAGHTAAMLNLVTEATYLEFRDEAELPEGQQAQIRAEIAAWQEGREPPSLPLHERNEGPPLTRWEWFQHRTLREVHDTEQEEAIVASLVSSPRPEAFDNPDQHIAFLTERANIIEASINRPVPGGGTRERADQAAVRHYRSAATQLRAITAQPFELNQESFEQLLAIDEDLEAAWQAQLAYTQRRLGYLEEFIANSGPLVHVVWSGGTQGAIEDAQLALARVTTNPDLSHADRQQRSGDLLIRIRELEETLSSQRRENAPVEVIEGRRFRFTVIPECGAIETMAIYIAAILGFPALMWKRLAGIVLGIPLLYAVNIFRLSCLGLIGAWFDTAVFDFAHHYVWQAIYLVFVVVVWLLWMELFVRRGEKSSPQDA